MSSTQNALGQFMDKMVGDVGAAYSAALCRNGLGNRKAMHVVSTLATERGIISPVRARERVAPQNRSEMYRFRAPLLNSPPPTI